MLSDYVCVSKEDVINTFEYNEAYELCLEYFKGDDLAAKVFLDKYALRDKDNRLLEATPDQMHKRIAKEIYRIEKNKFKKPLSYDLIYGLLKGFSKVVPQGSLMYGIGNFYQYVTLSNCYVLESPLDSYASIHKADEELSHISKRRGGIGLDLSNIRPEGVITRNAARTSTGIIPFMERYSNSIREVGQCIAKGERVLTTNGLRAIEEVNIGDEVCSEQGWAKVTNVYANGVKKVYKLTTDYGYTICASEDHLFLAEMDQEKKLSDFEIGDQITLLVGQNTNDQILSLAKHEYKVKSYNWEQRLTNINIKLPTVLTEKLAYILGYSFGDGYVALDKFNEPCNLDLACSHDYPEIEEKLIEYISDVFGYKAKSTKGDGAVNCLGIYSKQIMYFLKENGLLKQKAYDLVMPSLILKSSASVQMAFLSGYMDSDGDCVRCAKKTGYRFTSICNSFLKDCQVIFMMNGIVSKIHHEPRNEENWHDKYRLVVVGAASQRQLLKLMTESVKVNLSNHVSKRDGILTLYRASKFNVKRPKKNNYIPDDSCYLSLNCYRRMQEANLIEHVNPLVQDKVCSIELCGEEETYDLEVDSDDHMFWCEGFYVHNSGRRGAALISLSVHHPQVLDFIKVKRDLTKVTGANISVRLTDEFLKAVDEDADYEQRWPVDGKAVISHKVSAKKVWDAIIENAHAMAEPGLLFWDTIIKNSPADCYANFGFKTESTNPCSELPLSPNDSCRLLLLNLISYVKHPYTNHAFFDFNEFYNDAQIAQRIMDDVIDLEIEAIERIIGKVTSDPEPLEVKIRELKLWQKIKVTCMKGRRTGTGITALGDTLAALNIPYGSDESIKITDDIYRNLKLGCYRSSVDMAKELGAFPIWDYNLEKDNPFLLRIAEDDTNLYEDMKKYGRRNIALLTTAPAGTVSVETQTTSGIEPLFCMSYIRRKKVNPSDDNCRVDFVDQTGDSWQEFTVYHNKLKMWMDVTGCNDINKSPYHGSCADELDWRQRVKLQATAHKHVDHSISSTLNIPEDVSVSKVAEIYETAWKAGCKGITVYRKNCRSGVLIDVNKERGTNICKTVAPVRPEKLACDVYFQKSGGDNYFVVVGVLKGHPYEVFAGNGWADIVNDGILCKVKRDQLVVSNGMLHKLKRGYYRLIDGNGDTIIESVGQYCDAHEEALTRMISTSLRHGADISFIVHQLEKTKGDMFHFAKVIARILKKYIKDGTKVSGEICKVCNSSSLVRQEGCVVCMQCGGSKCG
jgi:ribonucleoside-diphosphate reductase alpha chain